MRRGVVIGSIFAGAIASVFGWVGYQRKHDPYGMYYRLSVDLSDKQGRPIGIDIIVGCSLKYSRSIGGGASVDPGPISAKFFAWSITDGHAVSINTDGIPSEGPEPCQGETTANGRIAKNWLPMLVWYERADDLSHGVGYYTRKAYMSPKSNLRFISATVEKATSQDFENFLRHSTPNLLPSSLSGSFLRAPELRNKDQITGEMIANPKISWAKTSWLFCHGIVRWEVSETFKSRLLERNKQGSQNLTIVFDRELSINIRDELNKTRSQVSRSVLSQKQRNTPVVLPVIRDDGLSALNKNTFKDGTFYLDVSTRQAEQDDGFVFCDRQVPPILFDAVTGLEWQGSNVVKLMCRIDGRTISNIIVCPPAAAYIIGDNKYVFQYINPVAE